MSSRSVRFMARHCLKKKKMSWEPVAHSCNPSYLGGKDQEDHSSKPAQANSLRDPMLKNPSQK
jgi:hypothetical protein